MIELVCLDHSPDQIAGEELLLDGLQIFRLLEILFGEIGNCDDRGVLLLDLNGRYDLKNIRLRGGEKDPQQQPAQHARGDPPNLPAHHFIERPHVEHGVLRGFRIR